MTRMVSMLLRALACVALSATIAACATSRVARSGEWVVLHPDLPAATGADGGWTVGEGAPNPGIVFPLPEVAGRWVRFGGTVADARSGLEWRINAFRGQSIATRSIPSLCDARRRCRAVAWIPADATRVSAVVYTFGSTGEVHDLTVEVGRPGSGNAADRSRLGALLASLKADYYRSDETDWPAVERNVAAILTPPSDVDPLPTVAQYVRDQLPGNQHMSVTRATSIETSAATTADPPTCGALDGSIGLLVLPGFPPVEGDGPARYAQALQDCLMATGERPWVIDLRGNGGGNMYPMIAGVSPLLSPGPLYAFVDGHRRVTARVSIGPSGVSTEGWVGSSATPEVGRRTRAAVVVLLGPRCGSSCEQVANALASRPRTLFVGQDTGGLTSANALRPLNDDYRLALTTGYTADPCGRPIADRLHPDVVVDRIDERAVADVLAMPAVHDWLAAMRERASLPVAESERGTRCNDMGRR